MALNSKIAWTDHTFNPWRGCLKVAAECEHCYALDLSARFGWAHGQWGTEAQGGTRVLTGDSEWNKIRRLSRSIEAERLTILEAMKEADRDGGIPMYRPRVFVASLADVFEDWSGPMLDSKGEQLWLRPGFSRSSVETGPVTMADCRLRLFDLIDECRNLDFLLLTKRPENIRKMWPVDPMTAQELELYPEDSIEILADERRDNVWLGTSAGTQATANRALPHLVGCRDLAKHLFVSAEPLLEQVDLSQWLFDSCSCAEHATADPETGTIEFCRSCDFVGIDFASPSFDIDWIIAGAESGGDRREFKAEWADELASQASYAKAAFFMKQGSAKRAGQQAELPDQLWAIKQFPGEI